MSSSDNTEKEITATEDEERERYNRYILEDGIHQRIQTKIDKRMREAMMSKAYERARKRIREKGGMITHDAALKWVVSTQSQQIREEIIDDAINGLAEFQPVLAENLRSKDQKIREDAMRVLDAMLE